jgi:hypothetical protein
MFVKLTEIFIMCKEYIGKQFKCTDPDFKGCIGTIVHAWVETEDEWPILYLTVEGEDFRGAFNLSEGAVV